MKLIIARSLDNVIGIVKDGEHTLPWHCPEDMAYFKEQTSGGCVIMGRNTWDSIPAKFRPLPNRTNLVVTTKSDELPGAAKFDPTEDNIKALPENTWVIGGSQIYKLMLPWVDEIHITTIYVTALRASNPVMSPDLVLESYRRDQLGTLKMSKTGIRYRTDVYRYPYRK